MSLVTWPDCSNGNLLFLNTVITRNGSWVFQYDSETKVQTSLLKHSSSLRQARQVGNKVKVMLIVFSNSRGLMHFECASKGQKIMMRYWRPPACDENDQICGQREIGSFIMTTNAPILQIWLRLSWPTTFLCFDKLHILPIKLLVNFGCFSK